MKIEISIINDTGDRTIIATNSCVIPEGDINGCRSWAVQTYRKSMNEMSPAMQWATSFLCIDMFTRHMLLDPAFRPGVAAVAAYNEASIRTKAAAPKRYDIDGETGLMTDDTGNTQHLIRHSGAASPAAD